MTTDAAIETSDPKALVTNPLVSVLMITYNHGDYLAEAIEGIVHQQCGFPFELIIGEDASTDGTLQIALDYQRRYPQHIRVIHSAHNVGMNANGARVFARARGTYIAYCEGDDFWCVRDKLAREVALIESADDIGIVHSDWARASYIGDHWAYDITRSVHRRVPVRLLSGDLSATWYFPKILRTCTILLRKTTVQEHLDSGLTHGDFPFGDTILAAYVALHWRVAYLPEVTAIYRVSPNSALRSGAARRVDFYRASLRFDTAARTYFSGDPRYGDGYRWDSAAGLLVWGLRAHDARAMKDALLDFWQHFTPWRFMVTGWKTTRLRLPTWRRAR